MGVEKIREAQQRVVAHLGSAAINLELAAKSLGECGNTALLPLQSATAKNAAYYGTVAKYLAGDLTQEEFEQSVDGIEKDA